MNSSTGRKEVVGLEFIYRKTLRGFYIAAVLFARERISAVLFFSKARLAVVEKSLRFARRGNDFIEITGEL